MAAFPEEEFELVSLPTVGGEKKKIAAGLALCLSNLKPRKSGDFITGSYQT